MDDRVIRERYCCQRLFQLAESRRASIGVSQRLNVAGRLIGWDRREHLCHVVAGNSREVARRFGDHSLFLRNARRSTGSVGVILRNPSLRKNFQRILDQMASFGEAILVTLSDVKVAGSYMSRQAWGGEQAKFEPAVDDFLGKERSRVRLGFGKMDSLAIETDPRSWRFAYEDETVEERKIRYRILTHRLQQCGADTRSWSLGRLGETYEQFHRRKKLPSPLSKPRYLWDNQASCLQFYDCAAVAIASVASTSVGSGYPETGLVRHWAVALDAQTEGQTLVMSTFKMRFSDYLRQTCGLEEALENAFANVSQFQ